LVVEVFEGGNSDIWIEHLEGGPPTRLTFDPGDDESPLWTPDGERVVFYSSRDGGGMFWKAANGAGGVERLTTSSVPQFPEAFSPDGTQLVFRQEKQGESDLYLLSMEGDYSSQPLLATRLDEDYASISPDGRWIAYESGDTGGQENILLRAFPNVEEGPWQVSRGGGHEPHWGPNGQELFYRVEEGGEILVVTVQTEPTITIGNPTVVFVGGDSPSPEPTYAVSSDSQRVLIMRNAMRNAEQQSLVSGQTSIAFVENWFEELNRLAPPSP